MHKDIELGRLSPPHTKRRPNDPDAIEVRLGEDPAQLLGWIKGLVQVAPPPRQKLRGAQVYPFNLAGLDSEGCMASGQTMVATDVIETCHVVDGRTTEAWGRSRVTMMREANPYPVYATLKDHLRLAVDGMALVSRWRYLPVTMDLFEQLFDLPDFAPAGGKGTIRVTNLQWVHGRDVGMVDFLPGSSSIATSSGPLLKPATSAPLSGLPKSDPGLLDTLRRSVKPGPDFLGAVTGSLAPRSDVEWTLGQLAANAMTYNVPGAKLDLKIADMVEAIQKTMVMRVEHMRDQQAAAVMDFETAKHDDLDAWVSRMAFKR